MTILFGLADPSGEPVVAHRPFVMNTVQEINEAIRDYQAGKFGTVRIA
jgi:redox-sensitive bicupin YhaK (pirin superfamily)